MQILVNDLIKSLPYTLSYFFKVLTLSGVKSHIVLNENDLVKLKIYLKNKPYKTNKSQEAYRVINKLINEVKNNER